MFTCISRKQRKSHTRAASTITEFQRARPQRKTHIPQLNVVERTFKPVQAFKIQPPPKQKPKVDSQPDITSGDIPSDHGITRILPKKPIRVLRMETDDDERSTDTIKQFFKQIEGQIQHENPQTRVNYCVRIGTPEDQRNSQTSFAMGIHEQEQNISKLIKQEVDNLTDGTSFFPKMAQASLEGLKKDFSESWIPESQMETSKLVEQQILQASNQLFTKSLLDRNYQQAYKVFLGMGENEKNGQDSRGNTPLFLATLFAIRYQGPAMQLLKQMLREPTVDPFKKSRGSKPLEQAILYKSIPAITNLFRSCYYHRVARSQKSLKQFAKTLLQLPDLQLELYVKVGSFVPLVGMITPDDTIKIYKKGCSLRVDYTLVGFQYLQSKRRPMSCILHQKHSGEYTVLMVNHDKRCFTDLLEGFTPEEMVLLVQDLLSMEIKRIAPRIQQTKITQERNIFREIIRQKMEMGVATKHSLKVCYIANTQKVQPKSKQIHKDLKFLDNHQSYSQYRIVKMIKPKKKQINLGLWLCKKSPISVDQLIQIMKFLSFSNEAGQIISDFLSDENVRAKINGFPTKIEIPMSFSLFLDIRIAKLTLKQPAVNFDFISNYSQTPRAQYQKTLIRPEKRAALLKFYT